MDRKEQIKKNEGSENGSENGSNEDSENEDKVCDLNFFFCLQKNVFFFVYFINGAWCFLLFIIVYRNGRFIGVYAELVDHPPGEQAMIQLLQQHPQFRWVAKYLKK